MATSSNFPTSNGYIVYYIEIIQNSQDIANNKSNVTVKVWVKRTNTGYTTYGTGTVYVNIDGGAYSAGITTSQKITSTPIVIFSKTLDITHNSDGTKTLTVSSSIDHSVFTASSHSFSTGLTTIARASQPSTSAQNTTMNSAVTIYTNRADASFTHTLRYSFGNASGTIATNVGASYAWTVPLSLANQIPNDMSGWGYIFCDTYSGGTKIGTKQIGFGAVVPASVVPTFTSVTAAETYQKIIDLAIGSYVQSLSKPKFTINGAAGAYSSTISKYEFTFEGTTYSGNNYTMTTPIKGSGTITVTAKITDSRGQTATKTLNLTVLAYASPKIVSFSVDRANSDGTLNDMGTSAKVVRNVTWNTLNAKNSLSIVVKSKARGASTWTTNNTTAAGTSGSFNTTLTVGTFAATSSFDFQVEFTDQFNTTIALAVLSTGVVTMSWSAEGVGIGKVWEKGALDVAGDANFTGGVYSTKEVGVSNPVNGTATANLNFGPDNIARIRYGGTGDGALGGFQIVGSGDSVKWKVDESGNVTNIGGMVIKGLNNALKINPDGNQNAGIEIGSTNATINTSAYIDYHTSIYGSNDYDYRLLATGGGSSNGQADVTHYAASHKFNITGAYLTFNKGTDGHPRLDSGQAKLKFLTTGAEIQVRNAADNGYAQMTGSAFTVPSLRELKTNIVVDSDSALGKIINTAVYKYNYTADLEIWDVNPETGEEYFTGQYRDPSEVQLHKGLIIDETPEDILNGDAVDLYAMNATLWKAIQELSDLLNISTQENKDLKTQNENISADLQGFMDYYFSTVSA